ncbi:hypothetical protein SAMN05444148_0286 [Winogradskyella jejuensis]|uniref:Uncharacterized protein n=1 Tax=Winogradskyella jejuensis TaxID=1089305 RepID=A0A1M5KBZ5_9FLAO|nr:hypothetical protein SAMN05444148_0286 [Winogradskyella jejuensis]
MKFIKEEDEERRDYIFQKDKKTIFTTRFVVVALAILIVALIFSYNYLK